MEKRLKWNAVGLIGKTQKLREKIKQDQAILPADHARDFRKLQGYLNELDYLLDQMNNIQHNVIPKLEDQIRIKFPTPELILISLSRPSIRNIFDNLNGYFEKQDSSPINPEEFDELAATGDAANVLALVGDAALDLAVVEMLWDSSLKTAGVLTTKRTEIVSNAKLASICDRWNLYEARLRRFKEPTEYQSLNEKIEHEKATLVEAIFGVIYLEFGFKEVLRILPLIQ